MKQWRFTHLEGGSGCVQKNWACTNLWVQREVPMSAEGAAWCHCKATPDNLCTPRILKTGRKQMSLAFSRRAGKRDEGNYRLASLTLIPRKAMEQAMMKTVSEHIKDKWFGVINMDLWRGNHVWLTWQTSTTKLFAWWRRGEEWHHLDLRKPSSTVSCNSLTDKLMNYGSYCSCQLIYLEACNSVVVFLSEKRLFLYQTRCSLCDQGLFLCKVTTCKVCYKQSDFI